MSSKGKHGEDSKAGKERARKSIEKIVDKNDVKGKEGKGNDKKDGK